MRNVDQNHMDLCRGPLFWQVILFSGPLILSGMLQLLFNAADLIVVGRYSSHEALAAIGCTNSISHLYVNLFVGLSVGANVVVATCFGAKDRKGTSRATHTSIAFSLLCGVLVTIAGAALAKPLLILTETPASVLPKSCTYLWICCAGLPFLMIYNFGSAVLRAAGDTKRPLYYLLFAGVLNVVLNLIFVICCAMDVAGVALATVISQALSAFLVIRNLVSARDACRLTWKGMRMDYSLVKEILRIGLPAGIQASFFSISNITVQSAINSFGAMAMAGSTATLSMEGIVYTGSYAYHQTIISFIGQNLGGRKFSRIRRSIFYTLFCAIAVNVILSGIFWIFRDPLLSVFSHETEVIRYGFIRMKVLFATYFLCGIMDVFSGALRGMGHSLFPAVVTMLGTCVFRIFWVICLFPLRPTMAFLMLTYPVSWLLIALINGSYLYFVARKIFRGAAIRIPKIVQISPATRCRYTLAGPPTGRGSGTVFPERLKGGENQRSE